MFLHIFFMPTSSPRPQSKGSLLQDPLPIEPSSLRGRAAIQLAGSNVRAGIAARRVRRLVADGRSEDDDPRGGARRATGAVNALDCGDGRGIAGVMTTTMMEGPGDNDVKAVGRFARGGRR